jgi:hypothetical protein
VSNRRPSSRWSGQDGSDVVPADLARATSFLRQTEERLNQLPLLTSVVVKDGIAYGAVRPL